MSNIRNVGAVGLAAILIGVAVWSCGPVAKVAESAKSTERVVKVTSEVFSPTMKTGCQLNVSLCGFLGSGYQHLPSDCTACNARPA